MARGSVTRMVSPRTGTVSWRARVSFIDDDGGRRHRSKSFSSRKAAERWQNAMRAQIDRDEYADPSPVPVSVVAAQWLRSIDHSRAPSTAMHYHYWWERVVAPAFGDHKISAVRPTQLQMFYDDLADTYSSNTITMIHKVVRGIFSAAMADGLIRTNPADGRRLPQDDVASHAIWTPAQARVFLEHLTTTGGPYLYSFILATGVRIGEALALAWEDVSVDQNTAFIHRTVQRTRDGYVIADRPKTDRSRRTIVLPTLATTALDHQPHTSSLVFPGADGTLQSPDAARRVLMRLCGDCKLPVLTPHDLRRTAATLLARQNVNPAIAARQMGHSVEMMLKIYTQVSVDMQERAADAIDEALIPRLARTTTPEPE